MSVIRSSVIVLVFSLAPLRGVSIAMAQNQLDSTSDEKMMELTADNLEDFLDAFVPAEMQEAHVPGLVITVVSGDEVLVSKS